jgi:N-acetylglucosaminyl-diphospho-decaprenol L-rhamnosyltransferase
VRSLRAPRSPRDLADRLDAVVVDYYSGDALARCVESLRRAGTASVVVVDNAVPPGRAHKALGAGRDVPGHGVSPHEVLVVEPGANLGYGSGANRGAAACGAEVLVVSNPDVVVDVDALNQLVAALDADAGLAIVGPRVLEPGGKRYPSARRFPSLVDGAGHALAGLLAPGNRFTRRYRMEDENPETTTKVDWVSGSFMVMRRQAFDELGGFDEAYFMYGEDVDLCWRAHMAGWGVAYVPSATVTHRGGLTTGRTPYRMLASHHRSALRFAGRTLSGPRRLALPAVALALGGRLAFQVVRQATATLERDASGLERDQQDLEKDSSGLERDRSGGATGTVLADG